MKLSMNFEFVLIYEYCPNLAKGKQVTKVTFLVKEQNVSVIYTDVNGISGCLILHIS